MTEGVRRFIWIANRDVDPAMNIWGRMWRTPDGVTSGKFLGAFPVGVNAATVEWRFEVTK